MRLGSAVLLSLVVAVAGCGVSPDAPATTESAAPAGDVSAPIAGRTLTCQTGGPASNLTFVANGTLIGRLLDQDITGDWYVTPDRQIHTHVRAGAVSLRDNLRQAGNRWRGRTINCTG